MVLKRKLPTQEAKKDKVVETENQFDNFDMSIESEEQNKVVEPEEGHDLNDDFPDQVEDKPEDFIPAELRAMEEESGISEAEPVSEEQPAEQKFETAEDVFENVELKQEQENEDIAPVSFDIPTSVEEKIDNNSFETVINSDAAPAELPTSQELPAEDAFETVNIKQEGPMDEYVEPEATVEFENHEHADWNEVVEEAKKEDHKDENFEGFETVSWDSPTESSPVEEVKDERFGEDEVDFVEEQFGTDNGGIIPEIPGLEDIKDKPAEVMGENSQELKLNDDAKKKLVAGVVIGALALGGMFVYSNMDTTTEVTNRWSGSLTEASQDIAETEQEQEKLIQEGVDVTKTEDVIDFSELSTEDSDDSFSMGEDESSDPATEINLLDPEEEPETTASGKEVITATGDEELPEDVEEGANLITNITAEIERQKAAQKGLETLEEDTSEKEVDEETYVDDNAAELNKKVDDQLAEYRKLLAHEEDPGKKVKPGKFFSGKYAQEQGIEEPAEAPESRNVAKVNLSETASTMPSDYVVTSQQVGGHQIVEYPKGVARKADEGIRTLDHFRSLIVEKEDKRVRIPKGITPGLKNQGFPKFKVISIVPNYGLIGEYNGKKGILMIGDSFKGWELVGVYESYAEFKSDTRKHIISLK